MHSGPSRQTRQSRSPSRRQSRSNSTSSNQSQGQRSPQSESTRTPLPMTAPPAQQDIIESSPPVTAPPAQQDIIESSPPVATGSQAPKLHGKENLQNLPPDTLKNKYGKFQVQRGVEDRGQGAFGHSYSTDIKMDPNIRTHGSSIDFVQVVRSRGGNGNWNTTAKDHGWNGKVDESGKPIDSEGNRRFFHRAELTEQETGTGWRVDQTGFDTPFHGEAHALPPNAGRHHLLKKNEPAKLSDRPTIKEPGYRFDAMTTAMDKKTGEELGTLEWGFEVKGESTIKDRQPTLLEDNLKLEGSQGEEARERDRGRRAAYKQWNQAAPGKEQENKRQEELAGNRPEDAKKVTRIPNID